MKSIRSIHFTVAIATAVAALMFTPAHAAGDAAAADKPSLYERLGGQEAIDAVVDLFYVKILDDERVNHFFEDVNMRRQIVRQKEFLAAAFGGPKPYEGRDLRTAHAALDLTAEDFGVIAELLQASLEEAGVDEALVNEVMTIAASTKDAVLNREPASE